MGTCNAFAFSVQICTLYIRPKTQKKSKRKSNGRQLKNKNATPTYIEKKNDERKIHFPFLLYMRWSNKEYEQKKPKRKQK